MRAMYSLTIAAVICCCSLALAQSETPAATDATASDGPVAASSTTEAMQKDDPAPGSEPAPEPTEGKPKDTPAAITSTMPSLIHTSNTDAATQGKGVETTPTAATEGSGTTKTGTGTGTVNATAATATTPKESGAGGVSASIVCLLLSALPIAYYRS